MLARTSAFWANARAFRTAVLGLPLVAYPASLYAAVCAFPPATAAANFSCRLVRFRGMLINPFSLAAGHTRNNKSRSRNSVAVGVCARLEKWKICRTLHLCLYRERQAPGMCTAREA